MGLLSSTASITRYRVGGKLEEPILETAANGLKRHVIGEIDGNLSEKAVGWTSFEYPFEPDFEGSSFVIGPYLVFALRIDKKTIPGKVLKKQCAVEETKVLAKSNAKYLSKQEKHLIREQVEATLMMRVPATPNVYDVIWNHEAGSLWFFSTLKSSNEDLEVLFVKSFKLALVSLFPFTMADLAAGLSQNERDRLAALSPTIFTE